MTSDEASFFLNLAVIGAALLGLAFVTLSFFLVDLLRRYERTALPVFRRRDKANPPPSTLPRPYSLTDYELFDGDPVVLFVASSVGVTWIFFLLPLTLGLTAAWLGPKLGVLAAEMDALTLFLCATFYMRNRQIDRLRPYLTHEEKLWPALGLVVMAIYGGAALRVSLAALSQFWPILAGAALSRRWLVANQDDSLFTMKAVCVGSLLLGTYTTNKDMFIFFKTFATERMRERWIRSFVKRYPSLAQSVDQALTRVPMESPHFDRLFTLWNDGRPPLASVHDAFRTEGEGDLSALWDDLVSQRPGIASWMFDVPLIAQWAEELRLCLEEMRSL